MIEIKELHKSYNSYSKLFDQLNLKLSPGAYCLKGINGSGKSTLLKILAGIDLNYSGEIYINGILLKNNPYRAKKNFAFLPDAPEFYKGTPSLELIRIICRLRNVPVQTYLEKYVEAFNMGSYLHQSVDSLSLGQRKKVFLCFTLLHEIPVWLLDEPANGLDAQSIQVLIDAIILQAKFGVVLFSGHQEELLIGTQAKTIHLDSLPSGGISK